LAVTFDAQLLSIDKVVDSVGRITKVYLVNNLLHLACCERMVTQLVYASVVIIDDISPVLHKLFFGWVLYYFVPTVLKQVVG